MRWISALCFCLWGTSALAEDTVSIGLQGLPAAVGNPYSGGGAFTSYPWSAVFDGLTKVNKAGDAEPALAVAWQRLDDTTWRFMLRGGVQFQDGTPLTAKDVVFSLNQLTGKNGQFESAGIAFGSVKSIRAVDPLTVEISTETPDPLFPRRASILYVVPKAAWTEKGREGFTKSPVGTGPFKIEEASLGGGKLTAFRQSWRPPKLNGVTWTVLPDTASRIQGLLSGNLDIILGLSPDDIEMLERRGKTIHVSGGGSVTGISFITRNGGPLADPRVRLALNHAVNRDILFDVLLAGVAPAATQTAPRIAFGYNPELEPYAYDPELAKALLAEAGYPDGFSFVMEATVGVQLADTSIYQQVASDLAKIGVDMEVRSIPIQRLIRNVNEGGWDGQAFGFNFGTEPTMDALRPLRFHSCMKEVGWVCTPELMPMITEAMAEDDLSVREQKTRAVMTAVRQDAPALLLNEVVRIVATADYVTGYDEAHAFIAYENLSLEK